MAATITTMKEIGWDPRTPQAWIDPWGRTWILDADGGRSKIMERAVEQSVMEQLWQKQQSTIAEEAWHRVEI